MKLVETALLAAIVVVLQLCFSGLHIGPVSLSFVLIPIVIGGVILGPTVGMVLGACFGAVTFFAGFFGADPFTFVLIQDHPFLTAVICFAKGIAAGGVSALLYRVLRNKNETVGIWTAAAAAPIVNTGIFILGAFLFLSDTIKGNFVEEGSSLVYFVIIGCAGFNFLAELAINLVCVPVIRQVIRAVQKRVK